MFILQISSSAVGKCQDAIKDKVVDTWNEKVVVMEQKSIQRDNIKDYLKYMQNNYPGMYISFL